MGAVNAPGYGGAGCGQVRWGSATEVMGAGSVEGEVPAADYAQPYLGAPSLRQSHRLFQPPCGAVLSPRNGVPEYHVSDSANLFERERESRPYAALTRQHEAFLEEAGSWIESAEGAMGRSISTTHAWQGWVAEELEGIEAEREVQSKAEELRRKHGIKTPYSAENSEHPKVPRDLSSLLRRATPLPFPSDVGDAGPNLASTIVRAPEEYEQRVAELITRMGRTVRQLPSAIEIVLQGRAPDALLFTKRVAADFDRVRCYRRPNHRLSAQLHWHRSPTASNPPNHGHRRTPCYRTACARAGSGMQSL